ncbi:uncharacterized protein LOC119693198 [Plutella xylostella]|uniref:uncharacterized protein LOC119693198 n=1 Tax=Plutella xylostella TaxID=51655 RepID=UPI0020329C9B|nr:uncharacterized protein LOC119693198 [Plutella xylostella]
MMMAPAKIPTFSGADPTYPAARWVEEINDYAEVFGWSPPQKLLMARRALTGVAGLWLRTENTFKTFEELQRALLEEFPYDVNPKVIHELMTNRKKKRDESCYEYMLVMKELGKRGGFEDYVTIQYIVDGIEDCVIHKVMLYGVTTYPDLKEKLKIYEYMKRKMEMTARTRRGERPIDDVSVKQDPEQQQSSGCGDKSVVSVKQHSSMFEYEVRMNEANKRSNDYSEETEVTAIKNEYEKCQRQTEVVNNVNNKQVLQNKKEKSSKEVPIELESIKEEKIVEHKVEEVCETKVEEKVEKVVKKEHFSGEFANLVKKKDGQKRYVERRFQDGLMENKILYEGNKKEMMVSRVMEIARRVHENGTFSAKMMKEAMDKDYHILR